MGAEPAGRAYHFGPLQRPSAIAGLSWFQLGALGVCGTLGIGVLRSVPSAAAMVVAVALVAAGAAVGFLRVGGRTAEEWLPALWHWWGRGRAARSWTRVEGDAPPGLGGLRLLGVRVAGGEIGVLLDEAAGTYAGILAVRGGAFALADRAEKDRLLGLWGDLLDGWCVEGTALVRLQLVERTLPEDPDALAAHLARGVAVAPDSPALASYRRLLAGAAPLSRRHECFVVVVVSQAGAAVRRGGGDRRAACEVLAQELASLARRARGAELAVEGVLGPAEVVRCLRVGFDPTAALRPDPEGEARLAHAWPERLATGWEHVAADGVCHVGFWVAEWPRIPVGADFMGPLFLHFPAARAVSVVLEPVPPARAQQEVLDARTAFLADERLRERAGYVPSAFRDAQAEALARREADLAAGCGEFRHAAYVTVSAPDPADAEKAAQELVRLAARCRLSLWRLWGQADAALVATLPLGRGLR